MKTEEVNYICMNVRFRNLTFKLFALTEEKLQEEKRKLIEKLNNEFSCISLIKFDEVVKFTKNENITTENIDFTFNASDYGISSDFHTGLVGLRSIILAEITRRYYGSLK